MKTPESRKVLHGLTLRCIGAIGIGLAAVIGITIGLIAISSDSDNDVSSQSAAYTLKFPEDEQMLKDLSAQILKDAKVTRGAKEAADVEPASGDKPPE